MIKHFQCNIANDDQEPEYVDVAAMICGAVNIWLEVWIEGHLKLSVRYTDAQDAIRDMEDTAMQVAQMYKTKGTSNK
jgi:hypothetical protein